MPAFGERETGNGQQAAVRRKQGNFSYGILMQQTFGAGIVVCHRLNRMRIVIESRD